tara:strand:+ start:462 stop:629 length:168 start_codon:yes stop_codon:yes gene_type:complete
MKVGDLVRVGHIGIGLITVVHWDEENGVDVARIEYTDGTWSLESEDNIEALNESR